MPSIVSLSACACAHVLRGREKLRSHPPDKCIRRKCGHITSSSYRGPTLCGKTEKWAGGGGERYAKIIGSGAPWRPRPSLPPSIVFSCCSASLALVLLVLSHCRRGSGKLAGMGAEMYDSIRQTGPMACSLGKREESLENRAGRARTFRDAMQNSTPPPGVSYSSVGPSFPGSTSLASRAFKMHMDALDPESCAEDIIET